MENLFALLRPDPDGLLQPLGSWLPSIYIAVPVDRHELRSVPRRLPWMRPRIHEERVHPPAFGIADPDPFLPAGILHIVGLRVRHVDLILVVEGDSTRLSELRPRRGQRFSVLVE